MKQTKKQVVQAQRAAWRLAVAEGRVVRLNGGMTFKSFPTIEARDAFMAEVDKDLGAEVVQAKPEEAQ